MFESVGWELEDSKENKYDSLILSIIKQSQEPDPIGFQGVASRLNQINETFSKDIGIIRRFDFSSNLQRMSVIVRKLDESSFDLNVKGSPEKLRELCVPESIPENFHSVLDHYAKVSEK